jgi:hypothetical protein
MKSTVALASIGAFLMIFFSVPALCYEISIDIAPSTFNLAYQGTVVTVHTDIAYSSVVGASVTLNGIEIDWWKSDNRGNFVAKFNSAAIKDIVKPGETATLRLEGLTVSNDHFTGTGTIKVIDVTGRK